MKKRIVYACTALLAIAGAVAPPAQAEICLDFVDFVDGLELTTTGDLITGWWRNIDGEGKNIPIQGIIRDGLRGACFPGPAYKRDDSQNPVKAGVLCIWDDGCEGIAEGWDWYVYLDGLDGTLDVAFDVAGDDGPPGTCGNDDLEYEIILGPCPFGPEMPGKGLQQAVWARFEQP